MAVSSSGNSLVPDFDVYHLEVIKVLQALWH